ncbi:hypothetical protein [Mucilaginibacter ginkgonis]|uniref:Pentapeptide MXKDX repeat protein n=1 Tax=Mucilaginibacter ginkgonis TaxID=2682091 RepID=A0A6I4I117_9SPHI|nr:hypothetical protein [Mucilaginibacter ginkgonis]QQL48388.1 hypothetical protein GO620_009290 [Mucilaginibacter ginkgonis]
MKNAFKLGVVALALTSMVACKGSGSASTADSAKTDSIKADSSNKMDSVKKDSAKLADTTKAAKDTTKKM